jgi:polysaccharide pyruvyl transferase WcaK-like protein
VNAEAGAFRSDAELAGIARAARRRPATIALFGLFGCGNLGNDGSLEAMLGFVRRVRPDAELVCICDRPAVVAGAFGLPTAPISRSRHLSGLTRKLDRLLLKLPGKLVDLVNAVRHIRRADVMIVPGTGILDDFGERPYGMPFDLLSWFVAARLVGVRVAMVSIGAGPIGHPLSRWLMVSAARLAHYRSYRDDLSRQFMESVGFDTGGDCVFPDLVFKLPPPADVPRPGPAGPTVGVGVMSYYGWYGFAGGGEAIFRRYVERIAKFVGHLLDSGYRVRLLTGEAGDWTAVRAVLDEVAKVRPAAAATIAAEPVASLHDLMRQIAQTDIVVATRFHNVVCALKMGKPTISLGYARKNDVLMADMGLGAFCHHVERFDLAELIAQFSDMSARRAEFSNALRVRNELFARQLDEQERYLARTLLGA